MRHINSLVNQRSRLLQALRKAQMTTFDIRHTLDIVAPAARVHELRHNFGHNIQTHWDEGVNPGGTKHRVSRYVLLPGRWKKEAANVHSK